MQPLLFATFDEASLRINHEQPLLEAASPEVPAGIFQQAHRCFAAKPVRAFDGACAVAVGEAPQVRLIGQPDAAVATPGNALEGETRGGLSGLHCDPTAILESAEELAAHSPQAAAVIQNACKGRTTPLAGRREFGEALHQLIQARPSTDEQVAIPVLDERTDASCQTVLSPPEDPPLPAFESHQLALGGGRVAFAVRQKTHKRVTGQIGGVVRSKMVNFAPSKRANPPKVAIQR